MFRTIRNWGTWQRLHGDLWMLVPPLSNLMVIFAFLEYVMRFGFLGVKDEWSTSRWFRYWF